MMSKSFFKVKAITNVDNLKVGDIINESDFASITPKGNFLQLEYIEDKEDLDEYEVSPGLWFMRQTSTGIKLETTSFIKDELLETFLQTKEVTDKIDLFFKRLHVYREKNIEIPIRRILLYGPGGTGKSSIISLASRKYSIDGKTAVLLWPTDKIEPGNVKQFIKSLKYINGVERLILIVEDIGGVEVDQVRMKSDSSLLSLLDNQEKTFSIPTLIIATTNHPEIFLGNLTNRPGRFSDKIEVKVPGSKERVELLKFFSHGEVLSEDVLKLVASDKCKEFTPDHLKEALLRAALYEKTLLVTFNEIIEEITKYNKGFTNKKSMGFGIGDD